MPSTGLRPSAAALLTRRWAERRTVVLGAALLTFAAVFAAQRLVDDPVPGIGLLATLPIVLIALELGLAGGLGAGGLAIAALLVNVAGDRPALDALGIGTRSLVFLLVAAVAGRFSDRMRQAYGREARLLESGLDLGAGPPPARVAEIAALAALDTPSVAGATVKLDGVPPVSRGREQAARRSTVPIRGGGRTIGALHLWHDRATPSEDDAALTLLAMQAGLAAENHRLRLEERERAAAEAELHRVRHALHDQRSGLAQLLGAQENERRRVAEKLHEDLAQVLAAVLMGLRVLERSGDDSRPAAASELHAQVVRVLGDLRNVATELRPTTLEQLDLTAALESLEAGRGAVIRFEGTLPAGIPEPVATGVFRIVQELLDAGGNGVRITVSATPDAVELGAEMPVAADAVELAAIRARAELLRGTVSANTETGLRVRLPLDATATAAA